VARGDGRPGASGPGEIGPPEPADRATPCSSCKPPRGSTRTAQALQPAHHAGIAAAAAAAAAAITTTTTTTIAGGGEARR
jgi:hypothetical protein